MLTDQSHQHTWVYGIVPAGARLAELGRRCERLPAEVRVVESGDLGVIVGDAPENTAKATRDQALAHASVLEAAVVDAPVVPFRFGNVLSDDAVTDLLEDRHDELAQLLDSVRDYVQFTLKADYDEEVVLREIIEVRPEIAHLREQTRGRDELATRDLRVRLGELVSIALEEIRNGDAGAIGEHLGAYAASFTFVPRERQFMVLNAPFLVERDRMREFEEAAAEVAAAQAGRMHLTLLGPMPAYDFLSGE
jgi:hypothetical protein